METTPLERALSRGQASSHDLSTELLDLGSYQVHTPREARAVCEALDRVDQTPSGLPCGLVRAEEEASGASTLTLLASLFQRVKTTEAYDVLEADGIDRLLRLYDARLSAPGRHQDDLLFLLKVFAMYTRPAGIERLVAAARQALWPEDTLWETIFLQFDADHPLRREVYEALRDPLPVGFTAVAYLDFANALRLANDVDDHPFDTGAGKRKLEGWLTDSHPRRSSYAHSATASLPFISRPERDRLLALALDHTSTRVQIEAAWASGMVGSSGGVKLLARWCLEPGYSSVCQAYLKELRKEDAIPPAAHEPEFVARAELCQWLSHPNELGRPPDAIRVFDARTLPWPPTGDERQVWLLEYRYGADDGKPEQVGIGMVGSVTYALFGEATPDLSAEDIYALHCCWELELNEDPRAPSERSVEAGLQILADFASGG